MGRKDEMLETIEMLESDNRAMRSCLNSLAYYVRVRDYEQMTLEQLLEQVKARVHRFVRELVSVDSALIGAIDRHFMSTIYGNAICQVRSAATQEGAAAEREGRQALNVWACYLPGRSEVWNWDYVPEVPLEYHFNGDKPVVDETKDFSDTVDRFKEP